MDQKKIKSEISQLDNSPTAKIMKYAAGLSDFTTNQISELEEAGIDGLEFTTNEGYTPIMVAAACGNYKVALELLQVAEDLGVKPQTVNNNILDNTPLTLAINNGHEQIASALVKNGAEVNQRPITPLMLASQNVMPDLTRTLLSFGANPLIKDANGKTASDYLMLAQDGPNKAIVKGALRRATKHAKDMQTIHEIGSKLNAHGFTSQNKISTNIRSSQSKTLTR